MSLRILLSSHGASPFGAERILLTLAAGLRDRGHDVTLEIPHEGPALDEARALPGVRLWHSRRPRLPRNAMEVAAYIAGAPAATLRLYRDIRRGGYDVVWVNSLFNPLAALAARAGGSGVVWHLHERNFRGPAAPVAPLLLRWLAHVPVPVSAFVAGTFARRGVLAQRMVVMFETLCKPITPEPEPEPKETFVVGYIGQFEPRKRVADLLEAVAIVPGTSALLAGDGKARGTVEQAIDRLGIRDRVHVAGFQRDVQAVFRDADCIVISSRDEPCALVAFESLAAGRPIIAADSGGTPEVLGDAALYYPLGDVARLAERIELLRSDPDLVRSLRQRALTRAARYTMSGWLDQAEAILARAAAAAGRAPVEVSA
jgi:glycosyltransferase involved in cell wall biosynthesis